MKTFTTTLIALLISVSVFAQEDFPRNEVSLNLGSTVFLRYPVITYERILAPDFSIGASLGFNLADEHSMNFNLTPFARWFFGGNRETMNRAGTGFFIEANTAFYSLDRFYSRWDGSGGSSTFDFGVGLGIGWKYLSRNNWTGEILLGGGRGFAHDTVFPRGGVSLGRRF